MYVMLATRFRPGTVAILPNLFIQHTVGGATDYNKLRFIQGSKLETQRSKSDGVLIGASASLPEMRRYSEKMIYAYGKSPNISIE
jgi:hypothetical protein